MILEEKIVRYVILASIFYGLFNLVGQFQSFLTPFIFNYLVVSIIGIVFSIRNRKESNAWILVILTLGIIGISISSGQFIYVVNLFAKGKVEIEIPEWINLLSHLMIWIGIGGALVGSYSINSLKWIKVTCLFGLLMLVSYASLILIGKEIALTIFLILSFGIYLLPHSSYFKFDNTYYRIALILMLNASLEVLKIVSILYLPK